MPLYTWQDKKTGIRIDVLRKFDDYQIPPTEEEAPGIEDPQWERLIGKGQQVVRGPSWSGSKGNW
jgi:predicted nucleic acid-binding Zn ribbon protein